MKHLFIGASSTTGKGGLVEDGRIREALKDILSEPIDFLGVWINETGDVFLEESFVLPARKYLTLGRLKANFPKEEAFYKAEIVGAIGELLTMDALELEVIQLSMDWVLTGESQGATYRIDTASNKFAKLVLRNGELLK